MDHSGLGPVRRRVATVCAVSTALLGLAVPSAFGADDDHDGLLQRLGQTDQGRAAKKSATKKSGKARASGNDYADGAIRRTARIADVSSDAAGTDQRRLVRVDVTQDLVGQRLRATATFRQAPTSANESVVAVVFGEWEGTTCAGGALIAASANANSTLGHRYDNNTAFGVTRSRAGATLTITSVANARFRAAPFECAYVRVTDSEGTTVYQAFYAESMVTQYVPKLSIAGGEPVQAARKGKWVRMRLEVHNSSRGVATNTRITASGKGLQFSPKTRSLGTIEDRSTKYGVLMNVRVAKKKAKKHKVRTARFTVTANGARATRSFKIGVAPKPTKYRSLKGRYFWGFASSALSESSGWDTEVIWFLNKRWVHFGVAKNGTVPKCRKVTKTCKRYTYKRKSGKAKIGKKRFKVTSYGFSYQIPGDKKRFYEPQTLPAKGARFATTLVNRDWSGYCLLSCTATTTVLSLARNGRFVRSSYSVGSWPGLGSAWSIVPPDRRGTYRVIGKGRVEFRYSNGKVSRERIGISHNALNKPSPTSGLVLDTTPFYYED